MPEILIPLTFEDLPTKPPLVGRPLISVDLQQTVALLVGYDGSTRRLVACSRSGVLQFASATAKNIHNITASTASYNKQMGDIPTSEVMVKAHPANTGRIWFNIGVGATPNLGMPLDAGEWCVIGLNNLRSLHLHIELDTEKIIVLYTK